MNKNLLRIPGLVNTMKLGLGLFLDNMAVNDFAIEILFEKFM